MLKTFKARLTYIFICFIILISILIAFIAYIFIYENIVTVSVKYNSQLVTQLCSNIGLYFSTIERETKSLSANTTLKYFGNPLKVIDLSPTKDTIKKVLWDSTLMQHDIDDICVMFNEKKVVSLFNMYSETDLNKITSYYGINEILVNARFVPIICNNRNNKPALFCVKSIINSSITSDKYFIVTSVTVNEIFYLLKQINLGQGSGSCIVDARDSVQYSTFAHKQFVADMNNLIKKQDFNKNRSFVTVLNGTEYIISTNTLSPSSLSIVVYTPLSNVTQSAYSLRINMLVMICILALLAFFVSIKLSNQITKPITNLSNFINDMDNRLLPVTIPKGTEETNILYEKFNEMVEKINILLKTIKDENKLKRKAELLALQSQINPHFLYNTLDSINALAILRDDFEISNMTTSLAHLLRLSISQKNEFVSIEDEINHVKAYLTIQKIRYNDKFDVELVVDKNILKYNILKLILQPLVENSIYHGIELKEGKGSIIISAHEKENMIIIEIIDDGKGTNESNVTTINQNLKEGKRPGEGFSVGIYNVNERIRLYYGEEYILEFFSKLNEGSKIIIRIPKRTEDENV